MKKLTQMVGLLLMAGALVMGCKHDPENVDSNNNQNSNTTTTTTTTSTGTPELSIPDLTGITQSVSGEMTFANGNWQRIEVYYGSLTSPETSAAGLKDTTNFTVSGNDVTVTGGNIIRYQQMKITDSDELNRVKGNCETAANVQKMGGKTATVDVNENTITYAISGNYNSNEIDTYDNYMYTEISDLYSDIPSGATKLTNADNTKYLITWTYEFTEDMIKSRKYENVNFSVIYIKQ